MKLRTQVGKFANFQKGVDIFFLSVIKFITSQRWLACKHSSTHATTKYGLPIKSMVIMFYVGVARTRNIAKPNQSKIGRESACLHTKNFFLHKGISPECEKTRKFLWFHAKNMSCTKREMFDQTSSEETNKMVLTNKVNVSTKVDKSWFEFNLQI